MANGFTACRFCGQPSLALVCLDCQFRMHRAQQRYEAEGQDYRQQHADELAEQRRKWRQKRDRRTTERERGKQDRQGE